MSNDPDRTNMTTKPTHESESRNRAHEMVARIRERVGLNSEDYDEPITEPTHPRRSAADFGEIERFAGRIVEREPHGSDAREAAQEIRTRALAEAVALQGECDE